jgi:preprotein translocase subunit SecD
LYDRQCAGYEQAYFDQQCRLNPLYDRNCTGYAEAYALANVVPTSTTSTTTLTVAAPQIVVSTTGTVAVETPVIRDPVVNEVITRPATTAQTSTRQESRPEQKPEQKTEEKKDDKKEDKKDTKTEQRRVVVQRHIEMATTAQTVTTAEVKLYDSGLMQDYTIIQDRLYSRMLARPMQDNARLNRRLSEDSNRLYRELEDGQWRRN